MEPASSFWRKALICAASFPPRTSGGNRPSHLEESLSATNSFRQSGRRSCVVVRIEILSPFNQCFSVPDLGWSNLNEDFHAVASAQPENVLCTQPVFRI